MSKVRYVRCYVQKPKGVHKVYARFFENPAQISKKKKLDY